MRRIAMVWEALKLIGFYLALPLIMPLIGLTYIKRDPKGALGIICFCLVCALIGMVVFPTYPAR